jgi:4-hydroxybenzoate polyprenyltransferase
MSTPAPSTSASVSRPRLRDILELVKFSHTIFALPFALAAMIVAARGWPQWETFGWILVAMVGARTAAMGWNRIVDRDVDAANPRTQNREIPAGKVSVAQAAVLVAAAGAAFVFAAWQLNPLAGWLSVPTLAFLFFYSWCKRFTSLSHFVLGLCLGIAPAGAWVAVRDYASIFQMEAAPIVLCAAVTLWVAGFDVIYATMDADFDREHGLHSLVQKLGVARALGAARSLHAAFTVLLWVFGWLANLGVAFAVGVAIIGAFLIYEHSLVSERDLRRVNAAFFTVNGAIAALFLLLCAAGVWL